MELKTNREIRAEKFVAEILPFLKRTFLQKLFRKKEIKLGKVAQKSGDKLTAGSALEVYLPDPRKYFFDLTGNQIIFEDKDVIAFVKRAGITTHTGVGTRGDDLRSCAEKLLNLKLTVVHRLDRGTSGVIVFAKNSATARKLENAFRERKVFKKYFALVEGTPKTDSGQINFPLKKVGVKMEVAEKGLAAETKWKVIKKFKGRTLLDVEITTGRTHQIRAHLAEIGLPVVGDDLYPSTRPPRRTRSEQAASIGSRMFLHATELRILNYTFEAKISEEFLNF